MNRRQAFRTALLGGLAAVGVRSMLSKSDAGVPRYWDIREGMSPFINVEIHRHGQHVKLVVGYDLDADTVTKYVERPSGGPAAPDLYETLRGGISVHWTKS